MICPCVVAMLDRGNWPTPRNDSIDPPFAPIRLCLLGHRWIWPCVCIRPHAARIPPREPSWSPSRADLFPPQMVPIVSNKSVRSGPGRTCSTPRRVRNKQRGTQQTRYAASGPQRRSLRLLDHRAQALRSALRCNGLLPLLETNQNSAITHIAQISSCAIEKSIYARLASSDECQGAFYRNTLERFVVSPCQMRRLKRLVRHWGGHRDTLT
jgi:hypothetical protein